MRSESCIGFFCALTLLGRVAAQELPPSELDFKTISLEDGLSGYVITAVHKDALGYLWVGTQNGLNRYDGVRITTYSQRSGTLSDGYITALAESEEEPGHVWVSTAQGGVSRFDPDAEQFEKATLQNGRDTLDHAAVRLMHVDRTGVAWVVTDSNRLYRQRDSGITFTEHVPEGLPGLERVLVEPSATPGQLWVSTGEGVFDVGAGSSVTGQSDVDAASSTLTACAEVEGIVWCGSATGSLYRVDSGGAFVRVSLPDVAGVQIAAVVASVQYPGVIWLATRGQGLLAYHTRTGLTRRYSSDQENPASLADDDVYTLQEDAAGNLWVATFRGLSHVNLQPPRFKPYRTAGGVRPVLTLYEAPSEPGTIWLAPKRGGIQRWDRRTKEVTDRWFEAPEDQLNLVFAFLEDHAGRLWVGSDTTALYQLDRTTGIASPYPLGVAAQAPVYQIYEAPSRPGLIWVATDGQGLLTLDAATGRVGRRYAMDEDLPYRLSGNVVWALLEDPHAPGVMWVATHGGGLNRIDTGSSSVTAFLEANSCLPSDRIVSLAPGADSTLWLGLFDQGLVRFSPSLGTCRHYDHDDGLTHNDIGGLFKDSKGRLWMTSSTGLTRFDPEAGTFSLFTSEDGLQSNTFHYPARQQNARGEILVGGLSGFNIFHPDSIAVDTHSVPVNVTDLLVQGQSYDFRNEQVQGKAVHLTYLQKDVAFEFAAVDVSLSPSHRYRVRLEPVDEGWTLLRNDEAPAMRYPSLSPGRYVFHAEGTNRDGIWSASAASLAFVIPPPFWNRWWFWGLIGVVVVGTIISAYQYRIHHLQNVERTRQRIANDLHDDMGSKINALALQLDMLSHGTSPGPMLRERLGQIAQDERQLSKDLRLIVWLVAAEYDRLPRLIERMEAEAAQQLMGRRYSFSVLSGVPDVSLAMERRKHIYLLFKEALHNAVRHSGALKVTVEVECTHEHMRFVVIDDGCGFDPATVQSGHGTASMQSRADALEATLQVETAPDRGTRVVLSTSLEPPSPWHHAFTRWLQR